MKDYKKISDNHYARRARRVYAAPSATTVFLALHCIYLALACFALATDRLVIDARGIESYYSKAEADALPDVIAAARK